MMKSTLDKLMETPIDVLRTQSAKAWAELDNKQAVHPLGVIQGAAELVRRQDKQFNGEGREMTDNKLYDIEWTAGDGYHQDTGMTIDEAEAREAALTDSGATDIRIIQR